MRQGPIHISVNEIKPFGIDSVKGRVYAQRKVEKAGWKKL